MSIRIWLKQAFCSHISVTTTIILHGDPSVERSGKCNHCGKKVAPEYISNERLHQLFIEAKGMDKGQSYVVPND